MTKVAAGLMLAAVLIGTGWAAERVYKNFREHQFLMKTEVRALTQPDGTTTYVGSASNVDVDSDDPRAIETAKHRESQRLDETKQLIVEKKYELVKTYVWTYEEGKSAWNPDEKHYVYQFTLADGSHERRTFSMPLENVASWDDYQQKHEEQFQQRREQTDKAIAAGKFRLIDMDVYRSQICRDVESNQKINVQRMQNSDGSETAFVTPDSSTETADKPGASQQVCRRSSWKDHLQAIREGKRELLGLRTNELYTYELTLEDGSKTTFNICGAPLKKLEENGK